MSLLNQVLRDLDRRNASELERLRIPANVKPLPPTVVAPSKSKWIAVGAAAGAVLFAILAWVLVPRDSSPAPTQAVAPAAPRQQITPDADIVAQVLETERQNAREANGKLPESVVVQQMPPTVVVRKLVPESTAQAEPKPESSPQEASGSIRGTPLAEMAAGERDTKSKLEITPKGATSESETRRAVNMMERGLQSEPEVLLRQVLGTEPTYQPARTALFRLLAGMGRQEEAAALLADGLRLSAANAQWAMNLARLQAERDDYAGAWETLQRSLPYARLQADYRAFCGTVLTRLNRPSDAIDHYRNALRIKPDEGRWWVGLGLALEADGKAPEARDAFLRAQTTGSLPPDLATFVEGKLKR